ncbi:MAG: phenylalanine--tRNA ligase subunit beta [Cellvibrionaceae bacterium]
MKISESWLREWVNPELTTAELAEQITMAGLEVDGVEPVAVPFSGVIVGEILFVEQHQDADKLRVCQVGCGSEEIYQVVCGAPNARAGIKVPFAQVGAVLPGDFNIKKAKLRGVESFGMLCAQTELKLGDDDDGLWELAADAPVGKDLRDYLQLDDNSIDVDLTPNRSDCLSLKGIAREVGVLNRLTVNSPLIEPVEATITDTFPVELQSPEACPRYAGRIIRGIDLTKPTPLWMQERLRRAGIGSKDIAVDTTNYVLLELGQPMHAFDLSKLNDGIVVRDSVEGEQLALLDGQTVELDVGTLVIADKTNAVAMAGIMGGSESAVSATTKDILLESAFFIPTAIAGRARNYGLHTDSSHRFERGVDYQLQEQAIERATRLIIEVAGGEVGPVFIAEKEHKELESRTVELRRERIVKGLGFDMPDEEVVDILHRLGLVLDSETDSGWRFTIPSYRFDIAIEADLLEELARIYGYNRLPTTSLTMAMDLPEHKETAIGLESIRAQLVARDYQEAISYSFVEPKIQQLVSPEITPVPLHNPISADMSVMRTSLWEGLLTALSHNINRQQTRIRLFETGLRFLPDAESENGVKQEAMVAGLIYGQRQTENWSAKAEPVDFYDIKGDIESVLDLTAKDNAFEFIAAQHPALHPGQTAAITLNGEQVGYIGAIHPQLQKVLDLPQSAYVFELTQASLSDAKLTEFAVLSRFPEVRRDIAVIVDQTVAVSELQSTVKKAAGDLLTKLKVFDVYVGKGIDSHRKSVALGLTYQHLSRTLTDDEVTAAQEQVVTVLKTAFDAELR